MREKVKVEKENDFLRSKLSQLNARIGDESVSESESSDGSLGSDSGPEVYDTQNYHRDVQLASKYFYKTNVRIHIIIFKLFPFLIKFILSLRDIVNIWMALSS